MSALNRGEKVIMVMMSSVHFNFWFNCNSFNVVDQVFMGSDGGQYS
jgi:hypothetical protein